TATIELRTPLLDRRDIGIKSDSKPMEIVQFVLFCDYGYLERQEPQPGEFADTDLLGAGLGLRLGLGRYFQVRLDYGWAINDLDEATGETTDDGRLHLSVQAQF
ncbi:MAG: BamA/TamA family outer membrane protein, partial [Lentisphaerae bacterium]|nr:BamA/TamA family outer membrane protein [Lentisphaerota bacterium]